MDEKEAKLRQLKKLKEKYMVGEGKPERIDKYMGGKTPEGYTEKISTKMGGKTPKGFGEKINTKMSSPGIEEFVRRQKERRMIKDIEGDAIRQAKDLARRKMRRQALKSMGSGASDLARKVGKLGGKIPALGALVGPALTMALGGSPNDALASALDSEDLGKGSDAVGDMGLSNADRLMAERRALEGMQQRKLEDMPDTMADVRKRDRGIMETADMDIVEEEATGKPSPKIEALRKKLRGE